MEPLVRFFSGWRFPAWVLCLLVTYEAALLTLLFLPASRASEGFGQFANEFRVWCFGYDPATGKLQSLYVAMMLFEPAALSLMICWLWWRPLREGLTGPRLLTPALASLAVVAAFGTGLRALHLPLAEADAALPFPAERLRTELTPPPFELTDQDGMPTSLESLKGRVVLVTAVYASCHASCPMILGETRRVVSALSAEERAQLAVVAITLDPKHDTPEVLRELATAQKVSAPLYHLVTGAPSNVEALLDAFNVQRVRDPETGVISHANLFLLIGRDRKIDYRFALGDGQQAWLNAALKLLIAEGPRA